MRFSGEGGSVAGAPPLTANPAGSEDGKAGGKDSVGSTSVMFKLGSSSDSLLAYQGIMASTANEELVQKNQASGILDILVVIDSSASMAEEQKNLSVRLGALLSSPQILASDWQIGIVTTDPNDLAFKNPDSKCLRALLKKGDPDLEAKFKTAIEAGVTGDNSERGILNAVRGLKAECLGGKTWLRDSSTVAIVLVSDEDNCSNGSDLACAGQPDRESKYLTDYVGKIRILGEEARIYGILWAPGVPPAACASGFNRGNIYAEAITVSKGSLGSICDGDYSPTLLNLSRDISSIIRNQFTLKIAPPPGMFSVLIDGNLQTSGYKVVGKTLTFTTPPAVGSKITIAYDRAKFPYVTSKILPADAINVMNVLLDGVTADPAGWSFDPAAHQVNFLSVPAEGVEIRITFQRPGDIAGNQIALPGPVDLATLDIHVVITGAKVEWSAVDAAACSKAGSCLIDLKGPSALPLGTDIEAKFK